MRMYSSGDIQYEGGDNWIILKIAENAYKIAISTGPIPQKKERIISKPQSEIMEFS